MINKHVFMFLLLSLLLISLSGVSAENNDITTDVDDTYEHSVYDSDSFDNANTQVLIKDKGDSFKEDGSQTLNINSADDGSVANEYQGAVLTIDSKNNLTIGKRMQITGTLKDETGKAISDKEVTLSIRNSDNYEKLIHPITDVNGCFIANYTPISTGNHVFHGLYVSDDGYDRAEYETEEFVSISKELCPVSTSIVLNPVEKNYTLGENIYFSGTLTDPNNDPLVNKTIRVSTYGGHYTPDRNIIRVNVTTDENGEFSTILRSTDLGTIQLIAFYESEGVYSSEVKFLTSEIIDPNLIGTKLSLNPIYERLFIGNNVVLSGTLTDINNNPLADKTITFYISGGESDYGIYSYEFNTTTDENGYYSYKHDLNNEGDMFIEVFFRDDGIYGFSEKNTSATVVYLETIVTLDPLPSSINLGDKLVITGNYTDLNGEILPNDTVLLYITYDNNEESTIKYSTTTDDNGGYAFEYTPTKTGPVEIRVVSPKQTVSYPVINVTVIDNSSAESENNDTDNNTNENNTTSDNNDTSVNDKGNDDEKQIIDNSTDVIDNKEENITPKTHYQRLNTEKTSKKQLNYLENKKSYNKIILKQNTNVTLSWLNDIFKYDFKNKSLLIYLDDILVFNGTVSDDPSEVLFEILKKYEGEHLLKVVVDNDTYQKEVTII